MTELSNEHGEGQSPEENLEPDGAWVKIFFKPDEAMCDILNYNPMYGVWIILLLAVMSIFLYYPVESLHAEYDVLTLAFLIASGLFVYFFMLGASILTSKLMGGMFGGEASITEALSANVWATMPSILSMMIVTVMMLLGLPLILHGVVWLIFTCWFAWVLANCLEVTFDITGFQSWMIVVVDSIILGAMIVGMAILMATMMIVSEVPMP